MKIFIVILHYGDFRVTKACVESFFKSDHHFAKIVISNNANLAIAQDDFNGDKRKIAIIHNGKNLGFAGGVNVGIRYSLSHGATHVLLVNNDTIIEKPMIAALAAVLAKEKNCGIVGPSIRYVHSGEEVYDIGGYIDFRWGRTSHREVASVAGMLPLRVPYVSGCCMLIKRDVFDKVGFFDEQFFLYYEDVDFCLRAQQNGFTTYVVPSVSLFHELSKTIGKLTELALYHQTKSALLFGKKYVHPRIMNILFVFVQSFVFFSKKPHLWYLLLLSIRDGISF